MKVELWASHMLSQDTLSHGNSHVVFPALWKGLASGCTKLIYFSRKITKCLEFDHTPLDNLLGKPFTEQQQWWWQRCLYAQHKRTSQILAAFIYSTIHNTPHRIWSFNLRQHGCWITVC